MSKMSLSSDSLFYLVSQKNMHNCFLRGMIFFLVSFTDTSKNIEYSLNGIGEYSES